MKSIEVKFTTKVPSHMTDREIQEWVEFQLNARGSLSNENPLADSDLTARHVDCVEV